MAATPRVSLGASSLVKDWYLDIDTAYPATATWVPVSGVVAFKPDTKATMKDVTTFDHGGATASQKTADQWTLNLKVSRAPKESDATAYDVGQEALRAASLLYGAGNLVHVRWYEVNGSGYPVTEAWEGVGAVEWTEDADAVDDVRVNAVTITGHGPRTAVSPNPGSA